MMLGGLLDRGLLLGEIGDGTRRAAMTALLALGPLLALAFALLRRLLPRLRALGLAGKVLLGSDFPNIPYPYAEQLAGLVRLDLGDDFLRAVCWRNAARLFGLA